MCSLSPPAEDASQTQYGQCLPCFLLSILLSIFLLLSKKTSNEFLYLLSPPAKKKDLWWHGRCVCSAFFFQSISGYSSSYSKGRVREGHVCSPYLLKISRKATMASVCSAFSETYSGLRDVSFLCLKHVLSCIIVFLPSLLHIYGPSTSEHLS